MSTDANLDRLVNFAPRGFGKRSLRTLFINIWFILSVWRGVMVSRWSSPALLPHADAMNPVLSGQHLVSRGMEHDPGKVRPDSIRGGHRFSEDIMLRQIAEPAFGSPRNRWAYR
jgi:hypothetical protein